MEKVFDSSVLIWKFSNLEPITHRVGFPSVAPEYSSSLFLNLFELTKENPLLSPRYLMFCPRFSHQVDRSF